MCVCVCEDWSVCTRVCVRMGGACVRMGVGVHVHVLGWEVVYMCVFMFVCEDGRWCTCVCVCEDWSVCTRVCVRIGGMCTCACVRMGVCVHVHV